MIIPNNNYQQYSSKEIMEFPKVYFIIINSRIEMHTDECRKKVTVVALLLVEKTYIKSVKNYKEVVEMFLKKP